jgi:hypothetical protein
MLFKPRGQNKRKRGSRKALSQTFQQSARKAFEFKHVRQDQPRLNQFHKQMDSIFVTLDQKKKELEKRKRRRARFLKKQAIIAEKAKRGGFNTQHNKSPFTIQARNIVFDQTRDLLMQGDDYLDGPDIEMLLFPARVGDWSLRHFYTRTSRPQPLPRESIQYLSKGYLENKEK